jgi:hypothetical protein
LLPCAAGDAPNLDGENIAYPADRRSPSDAERPAMAAALRDKSSRQPRKSPTRCRPREAHHHQRGAEAVDGSLGSAEDLTAQQARISR